MLLLQGPLNIFNGVSHHPLDIKDGPVIAVNEREGGVNTMFKIFKIHSPQ